MATQRPVIIYRFDSPCGKYCYIGQTQNLETRIRNHGSATGDGAISRHCRACHKCNRARQTEYEWKKHFRQLGSATGSERIKDLENEYIKDACEEFIRDHRNPFPLNLRAEVGNGILLHAAKIIHDEQKSLTAERSKSRSLQSDLKRTELDRDSLTQVLANFRQERDSATQARDTARNERDSARRERHNISKVLNGANQELAGLRKKNTELNNRWDREKDSIRAGKIATLLVKCRRFVAFGVLVAVIVGMLDPEIRAASGRLGPALSLLVKGPSQDAVILAPEIYTPPPVDSPRQTVPPTITPTAKRTPRPTATPRQTDLPLGEHQVITTSEIGARACPLRSCTELRTLEPGTGVTVVGQVRGEPLNSGDRNWSRVILPGLQRPTYIYSSFLGPVPATPYEVSVTPLPSVTHRPSATPTATQTPRSTATRTPRPTATLLPTATLRQFNVLFDGGRVRACPRRDCDISARLTIGSQVTVLGEARGEQVQGSTLWYRIALPDSSEVAFVHSSLLGPPTPTPEG